jgi:aryl-alcohol dehydrogenase-like predicted oxidoreductase
MRRRFGENGTVSAVGFGCMSFGGFYGPTSESETMRALARALEIGVDFWDTANVYGEGVSETMIGKFSAEDRSRRSRITLATKFGIRRDPRRPARVRQQPWTHPREPGGVAEKARGRQRRPLLRPPGRPADSDRTHRRRTRALRQSRDDPGDRPQRGRARHHPAGERRAPIAAVQSEYSLWTRNPELGLVQAGAEAGAIMVAFSPVGRGYFSGLLQEVGAFNERDFRHADPRFQGINWRRNRERLASYLALARSGGVKPATLAVAWALAKAQHVVPIPGTRSAEHLEECAAAADFALDAARLAELERVLPVGFAAGERYSDQQWVGIQKY